MFCQNCGKEMETGAYCMFCGQKNNSETETPQLTTELKKKRKIWPIVVGCAMAVILLSGTAVYAFRIPLMRQVMPERYASMILTDALENTDHVFPEFPAAPVPNDKQTSVFQLSMKTTPLIGDSKLEYLTAFDKNGKQALIEFDAALQMTGVMDMGIKDFGMYITPDRVAFDVRHTDSANNFLRIESQNFEKEISWLGEHFFGEDSTISIKDMDKAIQKIFDETQASAPETEVPMPDVDVKFQDHGTVERGGVTVSHFSYTVPKEAFEQLLQEMVETAESQDLTDFDMYNIASRITQSGPAGIYDILSQTLISVLLQMGNDPSFFTNPEPFSFQETGDVSLLSAMTTPGDIFSELDPSEIIGSFEIPEDMVLHVYVTSDHKIQSIELSVAVKAMGEEMQYDIQLASTGTDNSFNRFSAEIVGTAMGSSISILLDRELTQTGTESKDAYSVSLLNNGTVLGKGNMTITYDTETDKISLKIMSGDNGVRMSGVREQTDTSVTYKDIQVAIVADAMPVNILSMEISQYITDSETFFKDYQDMVAQSVDFTELDSKERLAYLDSIVFVEMLMDGGALLPGI